LLAGKAAQLAAPSPLGRVSSPNLNPYRSPMDYHRVLLVLTKVSLCVAALFGSVTIKVIDIAIPEHMAILVNCDKS
jgi:hypothetical protein